MKFKKIIITLTVILLSLSLSSCISQENLDINEFIKSFNKISELSLNSDEFKITDNNGIEYSYCLNDNIIITLYANETDIIEQVSITCLKENNDYNTLCENMLCTFTSDDIIACKDTLKRAKTEHSATSGEYKITYIKNSISSTVLINHIDNEINTNKNPTLKSHINKEDISRPTIPETMDNNSTTTG